MYKTNLKSERGQVFTETLLCLLLICLIFFGLMQVFHIAVARMLTDYSAYCAARSRAVGFDEDLSRRSARVASIGASGKIIGANSGAGIDAGFSGSSEELFLFEKSRIPYYLSGELHLEYDHWSDYGESAQNDGKKDDNTHLSVEFEEDGSGEFTTARVSYYEYPLSFLTGTTDSMRQNDAAGAAFFMKGDNMRIASGHDGDGVSLRYHASKFLDINADYGGDFGHIQE